MTLALHQKPGSTSVLTVRCALTGAFSREHIISFHAASSFVQNELTDILTQKDVNKNTYEHYPRLIIFGADKICVQRAGIAAHTQSQKEPSDVLNPNLHPVHQHNI